MRVASPMTELMELDVLVLARPSSPRQFEVLHPGVLPTGWFGHALATRGTCSARPCQCWRARVAMISSAPSRLVRVTWQSAAPCPSWTRMLVGRYRMSQGDQLPVIGIHLIRAGALADHAEQAVPVVLADEVGDSDSDIGAEIGVAVIAHKPGPVAVDGGCPRIDEPSPPAARAIVGKPAPQPVPLQRSAGGLRTGDESRDPRPALVVVDGLVAGGPGTCGAVAEFGIGRSRLRSVS